MTRYLDFTPYMIAVQRTADNYKHNYTMNNLSNLIKGQVCQARNERVCFIKNILFDIKQV